MKGKTFFATLIVGLFVLPASVLAQNATVNQSAASSLAALPAADAIIYINPQRIIQDAAPRVLSEPELAKMRAHLDEMKQKAGVDLARVDYIVVETKFRKPSGDLKLQPPEFLAVASGDFSADSLLLLAKVFSPGKLRDEQYAGKTMSVMEVEELKKEAVKTPFVGAYSEWAITSLNATSIALGTPAYVKAAIDAGAGRERISPDLLASVTRDPNTLLSMAGSPWGSFAKSLGFLGTEATPRTSRCETKFGDFYATVTMETATFKLLGHMNADNPDTAKIITNFLNGLLQQTISAEEKDVKAQSILRGININPKDDEVLLQAEIPPKIVADFLNEQAAKKATPPPPKPPPRRVPRRRVRRSG
jgi:hypothetical protein